MKMPIMRVWFVGTVIVLLLTACGANAPAAPATPQPVALPQATASTAPAAASTLALSPVPLATSRPIADIQAFIAQVTNGPHDTVKASDGRAELLIPQGALPSGKTAADIHVTPIDPASLQLMINGRTPDGAFQIDPSGLQLTQPALFSVTLPLGAGSTVPQFYTVDGDEFGGLTGVLNDVNGPNVTSSSILIPAKPIVVWLKGAMHVELPSPGDQAVKKPFSVSARSIIEGGAAGFVGGTFKLTGGFRADFPLDPASIDNAPAPTTVSGPYSASGQFTCLKEGSTRISYHATFSFTELVKITLHGKEHQVSVPQSYDRGESVSFQCAPPTPTPTPSPTATATRAAPTSNAVPQLDLTLNLGPGRDGQTQLAVADLAPQTNQTRIQVNIKTVAGSVMPVSIYQGTCPNVGAVQFPLNNAVDGNSNTLVVQSLASLLTGAYAINVGQSVSQPNVYVACGVIPKGSVLTLGAGHDGDQSPGTVALLSFGAQTQVVLVMKRSSSPTDQPVGIYAGSCASGGSLKYALRNLSSGRSESYANVPLATLTASGYAIQVQRSTADPAFVACADVK